MVIRRKGPNLLRSMEMRMLYSLKRRIFYGGKGFLKEGSTIIVLYF